RHPADILRAERAPAAALAAAHGQGIAHRDLKAENARRTVDGRIKILDFGLARGGGPDGDAAASQVTQPGFLIGTPGYMAAGQLQGKPGDARADVFAFGVLISEFACDRTLPGSVRAVIDRCL